MNNSRIILIGGVGGSGTRIVANIINNLGLYIGSNLNASLDNLDWPGDIKLLLDKSKSDNEKLLTLADNFNSFAGQMLRNAETFRKGADLWATKVPGSFYYLPYLVQLFDNISYIHVIRHGLDMAFSNNRNQLRNWGSVFNLTPAEDDLPRYLLKYWVRANSYAIEQCNALLPERHMLIKFEDLCLEKEKSIRRIMNFTGVDYPHEHVASLTELIQVPKTIGRYKEKARPEMFDRDDIEYAIKSGYEVLW